MLAASRIQTLAIGCALACALLVSAIGGAAAAQASDAARAQERYYSSYGEPRPIDSGTAAARAQERYYASYGKPEPVTPPQSLSPSDDVPWLPIAPSIVITLVVVTASATQFRRLRVRRRRAARVTT
jgi:hypothetical protein